MLREVTLFPPLAGQAGNIYPFQSSLGAAVMRCCSLKDEFTLRDKEHSYAPFMAAWTTRNDENKRGKS